MRRLLSLLIASAAGWAASPHEVHQNEVHQNEARQIVAQSVANFEKDYHAALKYNYMQRDVEKTDAGSKVTISQVTVVGGMQFEKVLTKNGQPLSADQQRREDEKYKKFLAERATPEAQRRKMAEYENARRFLREVPAAFDFAMLPEQTINGRPNYVVRCTPKAGYAPKDSKARLFGKINATLWVDKQDLRWTKAHAEVIDTVAIGWIMARIEPGAKISLVQTRVAENLWLFSEVNVDGLAKVMLVKNHPIGEQIFFTNYRLASEPVPPQSAQLNVANHAR